MEKRIRLSRIEIEALLGVSQDADAIETLRSCCDTDREFERDIAAYERAIEKLQAMLARKELLRRRDK